MSFWGLELSLKKSRTGLIWSNLTQNEVLSILDFTELELLGFYFVVSQPFGFSKFTEILESFAKIDALFLDFDSENDRKWCIIFGSAIFLVFSVVLVFDSVVVWRDLGLKDYSFYLIYFVFVGFELQFWQLVFFVERRIRRINGDLRRNLKRSEGISTRIFF